MLQRKEGSQDRDGLARRRQDYGVLRSIDDQ